MSNPATKSGALKERLPEMIHLYEQEGWSMRKIASHLEVDASSVRRILSGYVTLRPKGTSWETIEQMNQLANQGHTYQEIAFQFGVTTTTVSRLLRTHFNRPLKRQQELKYEHLIAHFIEEYEAGQSLKQIAMRHEVTPATVSEYLHRSGVERRHYSETSRQYWVNELYFHHLTSESSFLLGVLFASGCLLQTELHRGIAFRVLAAHQPALAERLSILTDVDDKRWAHQQPQNVRVLQLFSLPLHFRLVDLGMSDFHYPTDEALDADAFWMGYLSQRLNVQTKKAYYQLSFPSESLRQSFLAYLLQRGMDVTWIQQTQIRRLCFYRRQAKECLQQLFPHLPQWDDCINGKGRSK